LPQQPYLRLQRFDLPVALRLPRRNTGSVESLWNVLRTVRVAGRNDHDDRLLGARKTLSEMKLRCEQ